ncbi:MAG: radical SAM protein [Deltaproteobacteria bacterium]|nr:radical SAM protein [Deltaproteobacteria bacterium]
MMTERIVQKAINGDLANRDELLELFGTPLFSRESALILSAGRMMSQEACQYSAEVHAQVGLNISPCPRNCKFCSFAARNNLFKEQWNLPVEEVLIKIKGFETDGANALYLMATAQYPFEKFLEMGREVKKTLNPETILIANIDDFSKKQALQLKDAGFFGIYHALRLGEGKDTTIAPRKRLETFRNAKAAGLVLGTCLEPVGPEHTVEELVEHTMVTREAEPAYSGAARRISIPGTELYRYGLVSEARMAHILAVVRLALGYSIPGNCTHEPNSIGAAGGANLFWAEAGPNPRDTDKETEGKRGMTVKDCRKIFLEAEWQVLEGPSKFFRK